MSAGVGVAGTVVHFVEAVKLLSVSRVTLDSALTFNQHVTVVSVNGSQKSAKFLHILCHLVKFPQLCTGPQMLCRVADSAHAES